ERVMAEVRTRPAPLRPVGFGEVLRHLTAPSRLAFSAVAVTCLVLVGMWQMEEPKPLVLSGTDQAFVSECLRDYHLDVSARLDATVTDMPAVAGLEF
ncbi:MAG: hypothetical protein HUU35_01245, partial [Armatimonadetes bacterium]|nr:hypothetical protein [Armatimonadota bacterium]